MQREKSFGELAGQEGRFFLQVTRHSRTTAREAGVLVVVAWIGDNHAFSFFPLINVRSLSTI